MEFFPSTRILKLPVKNGPWIRLHAWVQCWCIGDLYLGEIQECLMHVAPDATRWVSARWRYEMRARTNREIRVPTARRCLQAAGRSRAAVPGPVRCADGRAAASEPRRTRSRTSRAVWRRTIRPASPGPGVPAVHAGAPAARQGGHASACRRPYCAAARPSRAAPPGATLPPWSGLRLQERTLVQYHPEPVRRRRRAPPVARATTTDGRRHPAIADSTRCWSCCYHPWCAGDAASRPVWRTFFRFLFA